MVDEPRVGPAAPAIQTMMSMVCTAALALAVTLHGLLPLPVLAQTQSLGWSDGSQWRSLTLVPGMVADFTPRVGERSATLRAGAPDALSSPVFRDESGRLRALPGGVVVTLKSALTEADSQALFRKLGVQATRRLSDVLWLIEAPVGLPSLELANRLQASGAVGSAQPNWWIERRLR